MAFITSRQGWNIWFFALIPLHGSLLDPPAVQAVKIQSRRAAEWAGRALAHRDGSSPWPSGPTFPLSHSGTEFPFFWSFCKAAPSQGDQQSSAQHMHEHHREKKNISGGSDCFWSKNAQLRCDIKSWTAKRNQFPGGSSTRAAGPPQHPAPWDGLAASPLLSAASKGCKSEVWRGHSAN